MRNSEKRSRFDQKFQIYGYYVKKKSDLQGSHIGHNRDLYAQNRDLCHKSVYFARNQLPNYHLYCIGKVEISYMMNFN